MATYSPHGQIQVQVFSDVQTFPPLAKTFLAALNSDHCLDSDTSPHRFFSSGLRGEVAHISDIASLRSRCLKHWLWHVSKQTWNRAVKLRAFAVTRAQEVEDLEVAMCTAFKEALRLLREPRSVQDASQFVRSSHVDERHTFSQVACRLGQTNNETALLVLN